MPIDSKDIISQLDIKAEYEKLGLIFARGAQVRSSGFIACHAYGREDVHASACINVHTGRYKDSAGSGESIGFFDMAARMAGMRDWREARKHYAKQLGIANKLPKSDERPDDRLDWNGRLEPITCRGLVSAYPGITFEALQLCGAREARYPANSQQPQYLAVLPAFGPELTDGEPRGYVCHRIDGQKVSIYRGKDAAPDHVKRMSIGQSGLVGLHAAKIIAAAQESGDRSGIEIVWKVEGISDLLALQAAIPAELRNSHLVLTNSGGVSEVTLPGLVAQCFDGLPVAILHDCDKPGQDGAGLWLGALAGHASEAVNVVLPFPIGESHGQDLRDWLGVSGSYAELLKILQAVRGKVAAASQAGEVLPDQQDKKPHEIILDKLGCVVLGHLAEDDTVIIFSKETGWRAEIKNIDRVGLPALIQKLGPKSASVLCESAEGVASDRVPIKDARRAIATEAGRYKISAADTIGAGIWEISGERLALVGRDEVIIWDGSDIESIKIPAVDGRMIEPSAEPWWTERLVNEYMPASVDQQWCIDVMEQARQLFAKWDNLSCATDPELLAGLVAASFIQTVWEWRPVVMVTGPSNSGKSMLISEERCLHRIFGGLALPTGKSSTAGIRQRLKCSASVLMLDEFEHDKYRQEMFELLRVSSRGGKVLRGTTSQKGETFGLRVIAWLGAIETGMRRAADKNRCILVSLKGVSRDPSREKLRLPSAEELGELGQKILAVSVRHAIAAKRLAIELAGLSFADIDQRLVESHAVPAAMAGSVYGLGRDGSAKLLEQILIERLDAGLTDEAESDETMLLNAILEAEVIGQGYKTTVSRLLQADQLDLSAGLTVSGELERIGIKIVSPKNEAERFVFFADGPVRKMLRLTDFGESQVAEILQRLPGAKKDRQRLGSHRARGVSVPAKFVTEGGKVSQMAESFDSPELAGASQTSHQGQGGIFY